MILPSLSEITRKSLETYYRFPFAILSVIFGSMAAVWLVDIPWEQERSYYYLTNLVYISALSIAVFLSVSTMAEQLQWNMLNKYLAKGGALLLLAVYYFLLPENFSHEQGEPFTRYLLFFLAAHLLVSFAPFLKIGGVEDFWLYNKTLFLRILTSLLYTVVLFAGLSIAMLSLDKLLGFDIDGNYYSKLWILLIGIFNTWFFLAGIPKPDKLDSAGEEYPRTLKAFVQFILIPLVSLYIIILYLYTGKILIQWEWPNGWVANLVLSFSIAGIFSLLLLHPLRNEKKHRWIQLFSKGYYIALIPLVVLLFLSIWVRISEYGVTVNRYFVVILAVWLSAMVIYFLFSKVKSIKVIPITLCLFALAVSFGPQGAFETSKRSQLNRFETLLEKNQLLDENKQVTRNHPEVSFADRKQISSTIAYLIDLKGTGIIQSYFSADLEEEVKKETSTSPYNNTAKIMLLMDLEYVPDWMNEVSQELNSKFNYWSNREAISISGYDFFLKDHSSSSQARITIIKGKSYWKLSYNESSNMRIENLDSRESIEFSLKPFAVSLSSRQFDNNSMHLSSNEMTFEAENERLKVLLLFDHIQGSLADSSIDNFTANVFITEK